MFGLKEGTLVVAVIALFVTQTHQQVSSICVGQLDLVLMVDASNSVYDNNFRTQMNGLSSLVQSLDVGNNKIRIGVIVFSSTVNSRPISGNKQQVLNNIATFEYLDESTRTDLGLQEAMNLFSQAPRGNVPKLLIVITDGASTQPQNTMRIAQQAKGQGILIYAIGISDAINEVELRSLASSPNQVMLTPNFQNIDYVIRQAVGQACTQIITTTTTTPRPTLPPVVPQVHLCSNSGSRNTGIGYVAHHWECDKYYQCYYDPSTGYHLGIVRHCPLGMFYNRQTTKCDWPGNVTCPFEYCKTGCKTYPMSNSFRGYWMCSGQVSMGMCCPKNTVYVPMRGCVPSPCDEKCDLGKCGYDRCMKKPVWGSSSLYQFQTEASSMFGWLPGSCANNQLNMVDCGCTASTNHYCEPDFDYDSSRNTPAPSVGRYLTASGVNIGPGGATVGVGRVLHIDLHKDMGMEPVVIRVVYSEAVTPGSNSQILMSSSSNCNNRMGGQMQVIYNRNLIKVWLQAVHGQTAYVSVPLMGLSGTNLPKDITIGYNNHQLILSLKIGNVQFIERTKAPYGVTFPCGFDIGPTSNSTGFSGTIQRLSMSSCFPSKFH